MKRIEFENGYEGGTPIPFELLKFINELSEKNIIKKNTNLDAEFLNCVHLEDFISNINFIDNIDNKDLNEIKKRIKEYYKMKEGKR